MKYPKLFMGIEPEETVRQALSLLAAATGRWRTKLPLHITAKTPAGLVGNHLELWWDKADAVAIQTAPFPVELREVDVFENFGAVFLQVHAPALYQLNTQLIEAVNPSEEERQRYFEHVEYVPHLTLAEDCPPDQLQVVKRAVEQVRTKVEIPIFMATRLAIFVKDTQDAEWRVLYKIPFEGG